jgi:hypothetical protein
MPPREEGTAVDAGIWLGVVWWRAGRTGEERDWPCGERGEPVRRAIGRSACEAWELARWQGRGTGNMMGRAALIEGWGSISGGGNQGGVKEGERRNSQRLCDRLKRDGRVDTCDSGFRGRMEGHAIWGRGEPRSVDRPILVNERSRFDFSTALRAFISSRDELKYHLPSFSRSLLCISETFRHGQGAQLPMLVCRDPWGRPCADIYVTTMGSGSVEGRNSIWRPSLRLVEYWDDVIFF